MADIDVARHIREERIVLFRSDMVDLCARQAGGHRMLAGIAGCDDIVPTIVGHTDAFYLASHGCARAGCVGQQNDPAAFGAKSLQGGNGVFKGRHTIVHDTPKVAENGVIPVRDFGEIL